MNKLKFPVLSGKTALVADPDSGFRSMLCAHLEEFGFTAVSASSCAEAERILAGKSFDLVVTEIILEYKDSGFVLCYKIKKQTPETRIIIVSGVSFVTGIHFDLSSADSKAWIKADSILDKEIRLEQFDHELLRLFR